MSKKDLIVTVSALFVLLFPIALFGECNHPVTWDESDFPESAFETNPNWINNAGTINSLQYKVRFETGENYYRDILIRIESADLHDNWLNWIKNYDCDNQETLLREDYEIVCASPVTNKEGDTIIGYGFSNVASLQRHWEYSGF